MQCRWIVDGREITRWPHGAAGWSHAAGGMPALFRIGLISDTHGLLRPEAVAFLRGCDHILHGGDIGPASILEELAAIAPLTAVRGNNDTAGWAAALPEAVSIDLAGARLFVLHDLRRLALDPIEAGIDAIVAGHSHRPRIETHGGVLHVNPGSAGPRRFSLPVAVGELVVAQGRVTPRVVELGPGRAG
jgi:putative phosphoesterase